MVHHFNNLIQDQTYIILLIKYLVVPKRYIIIAHYQLHTLTVHKTGLADLLCCKAKYMEWNRRTKYRSYCILIFLKKVLLFLFDQIWMQLLNFRKLNVCTYPTIQIATCTEIRQRWKSSSYSFTGNVTSGTAQVNEKYLHELRKRDM